MNLIGLNWTVTDPGVSAKYCHGWNVFPLSCDLSNTQTPGRGEFAIVMKT